uniref:DUF3615 domain-containing protein n=1 Tax=Oryza punctata TaxID=4537 RepID=A0A0E0KZZ6_ORYPU
MASQPLCGSDSSPRSVGDTVASQRSAGVPHQSFFTRDICQYQDNRDLGKIQNPFVEQGQGEPYPSEKGSLASYYYNLPTGELAEAVRWKSDTEKESCPHPPIMETGMTEVEETVPFSDALLHVHAVLNRPWPEPILVAPTTSNGKFRTLVATANDIGPPISPEELAALKPNEDDDMCIQSYKGAAYSEALLRNYIHEHGELYQDEKGTFMFDIDNSGLLDEIRCKKVTAEEMEEKVMKRRLTSQSLFLPELALASYNKRRKIKFELCEALFSRSFWEDRGFFKHLNFVAKRKDKKKLFFAEIEECGQTFEVRCCIPLDSVSEGGYYELKVPRRPGCRKGLDFDKCYSCHPYMKHPPDGLVYAGGHDSRKRNYLFGSCYKNM